MSAKGLGISIAELQSGAKKLNTVQAAEEKNYSLVYEIIE